jgi:hypothetical protein
VPQLVVVVVAAAAAVVLVAAVAVTATTAAAAVVVVVVVVVVTRPDIIIKNKNEKTCTLIDVAIPADRNVMQNEAEKKLKYKSLGIEIQRMWNQKCTIIPVIIGATGIVTKSLRVNL